MGHGSEKGHFAGKGAVSWASDEPCGYPQKTLGTGTQTDGKCLLGHVQNVHWTVSRSLVSMGEYICGDREPKQTA